MAGFGRSGAAAWRASERAALPASNFVLGERRAYARMTGNAGAAGAYVALR